MHQQLAEAPTCWDTGYSGPALHQMAEKAGPHALCCQPGGPGPAFATEGWTRRSVDSKEHATAPRSQKLVREPPRRLHGCSCWLSWELHTCQGLQHVSQGVGGQQATPCRAEAASHAEGGRRGLQPGQLLGAQHHACTCTALRPQGLQSSKAACAPKHRTLEHRPGCVSSTMCHAAQTRPWSLKDCDTPRSLAQRPMGCASLPSQHRPLRPAAHAGPSSKAGPEC